MDANQQPMAVIGRLPQEEPNRQNSGYLWPPARRRMGRRAEPYRPLGKVAFQLRRYQRLPRKPENLYYGYYFGLGQEGRKRGRYRGRRRGDRAISKLGTSPRKREIRDRNPFAYDLYHYANAGYCFRFSKGYRGCFGCRLETFVYGRAPKSTGQMRGVRRLFAASIKRNTGVFSTNERQG